jgi:transcription factor E
MMKKFLKDSVSLIIGKPAEDIVDLIYNNKHVNEFLLSKKLKLTINQTRNILYKLSDYGIVSSIRKKDKRKGWYTYFWRIEPAKSLEFLRNSLIKKMEQMAYQIKSKETKDFYICERCNTELNEETALINSFTCNECGGLFTLKDNSKTVKDLQKNLEKLKEELKLIETELEIEKEKTEKSKVREAKKQKLIKDSSRKKKREDSKKIRDALKNKVKKSFKKNKVKSKTIKDKKLKKIHSNLSRVKKSVVKKKK